MLKKIIKNIKEFFFIIENIRQINKDKPKIIFYSENKAYVKYAYILIDVIKKKYPNKIYYVSSDIDDQVNDINIRNIYIGKGVLMQYFFLTIKSDNIFLTLTDLDNTVVKKNRFVKNYIYFFHGAVSTTKVYTSTAFDNYDTILCNGDHHVKEIELRENLYNLKKKRLIKSGYSYFDYLHYKLNKNNDDINEILIAPSWNKNKRYFINENFDKIIDKLINTGFKVRFRPHPENLKRSQNYLNSIKKKYNGEMFIYDDDPENYSAFEKAKCLITDNSGISIEFFLLMKRPIIYFDDFVKIHNSQIENFKDLETIEDRVKKKFGIFFKVNEINNIKNIIDQSNINFKKNIDEVNKFIDINFFNYNKTSDYIDKNLANILR
jgi:hypothetical protein